MFCMVELVQYVVIFTFFYRTHYEKKLKQKTLEVWQDIWWSGRKGWKLNVRADYHNRWDKKMNNYVF